MRNRLACLLLLAACVPMLPPAVEPDLDDEDLDDDLDDYLDKIEGLTGEVVVDDLEDTDLLLALQSYSRSGALLEEAGDLLARARRVEPTGSDA